MTIGQETNLHKSAAFDWIASVEETPNEANIALRIHGTNPNDPTVIRRAYVLLSKSEARDLVGQLLTLIH